MSDFEPDKLTTGRIISLSSYDTRQIFEFLPEIMPGAVLRQTGDPAIQEATAIPLQVCQKSYIKYCFIKAWDL